VKTDIIVKDDLVTKEQLLKEGFTDYQIRKFEPTVKSKLSKNGNLPNYYSRQEIIAAVESEKLQQMEKDLQKADVIGKKFSDEQVLLAFGNSLNEKSPDEILQFSLQALQLSLVKSKELAENKLATQQQENELLKTQLGIADSWFSVKRVAILNKKKEKEYNWRELKKLSFAKGILPKRERDGNYGEVNSYSIDVWKELYPNDRYN
jgi:hypothetical protein